MEALYIAFKTSLFVLIVQSIFLNSFGFMQKIDSAEIEKFLCFIVLVLFANVVVIYLMITE